MPFRTNIRQLRESRGLSQSALAEMIGTTLNHYGKLERGQRKLHETWLRKLAAALDVEMTEIVAEHQDGDDDTGLPLPTFDAICSMVDEHYKAVFGAPIAEEMLKDLSQRLLDSVENWREDPAAARDPQVARSVARQINRRFDH